MKLRIAIAADVVGSLQYGQKVGSTGLSVTVSMQKAAIGDSGYRYG